VEIPETRYAKTADGVQLAYQVAGDGPIDFVVLGSAFIASVDLSWEFPVTAAISGGLELAQDTGNLLANAWVQRSHVDEVGDKVCRLPVVPPMSHRGSGAIPDPFHRQPFLAGRGAALGRIRPSAASHLSQSSGRRQ
jgi:hypothetical protein